ncbi:MAG: substrate-binding domain-containing protein [Armatimonadetes bacterium]|nr:substrate-binding domain-containing protein [Armatimonadota bacterium]
MRRLLIFTAILTLIAGCSKPADDSNATAGGTSGKKALVVAAIPKGTTHVFWKSVEKGAMQAGKDLGVEVIWKGPLKEDNKDEQIKVVQDFITRKVDGIALAPLDANALRSAVEESQNAGIPVVIFDSAIAEGVKTASFVATNNKVAGGMAGKRLGELLNGKGKVMMMRYQEGSASTAEREAGFLEAIKAVPGIEVVSDNQYGGATVESSQKMAETLINRFNAGGKFQIDGIFCPNESSAFGMLRGLQEAGLAGKVKFVGFDSSAGLLEGLTKGEINALVVQNPIRMGYLAIESLVKHLRGEKVEANIDTGAAVLDTGNINSDEMQKLVNP